MQGTTTQGHDPIANEHRNIYLDGMRRFPDDAVERRQFFRQNQVGDWVIARLNAEWIRLDLDTRLALLEGRI